MQDISQLRKSLCGSVKSQLPVKNKSPSRSRTSKTKIRKDTLLSSQSINALWPNVYERTALLIKPRAKDIEAKTVPRVNQSQLEEPKRNQFVEALRTIVKNGQYADLVSIHSDGNREYVLNV